jgi:hypothetical protein
MARLPSATDWVRFVEMGWGYLRTGAIFAKRSQCCLLPFRALALLEERSGHIGPSVRVTEPVTIEYTFKGKPKREDPRVMSTAYDGQERVRPSGRNGNRLPLRRRGERIGGRQKGTPNKMSGELKEAIIAAAMAAARGVPSGKGGLQGFLEMLERRNLKAFCRLLLSLLVSLLASEKRRVRGRAGMVE